MSATSANSHGLCMYCGRPAKRIRKGEHILPVAIGGALTIKDMSDRVVCHECNNGVLSQLDRELCGRSFLSVVASQEIAADLWQAWDVDHTSHNLLVEAKPSWDDGELSKLVCYPQMTFEANGPELRGDVEEIERFGREDFAKVLIAAVRGAFQKYNAGEKKALYFECIQSDIKSRGYRFAPRIFTRHSISEIARNIKRQSFILRYASAEERRFALRCLSRLEGGRRFNRWTQLMGSHLPAMSQFFDVGLTMRALMKLGVNLLAAYCRETPVTYESFRKVIRVIRGDSYPNPTLLAGNGFVRATDIESLKAENRSHSFRLVYLNREWLVYSSFFGGRIGAVVAFPGPNHEEWNTIDIVAPLEVKEWRATKYSVIQPIRVQVEWRDVTKIAPSLKLQNAVSTMLVESVTTGTKG